MVLMSTDLMFKWVHGKPEGADLMSKGEDKQNDGLMNELTKGPPVLYIILFPLELLPKKLVCG